MSFDQLKREAVNLERQLEDKVSKYQQIAQKINQATISHDLALQEQGGIPWDEEATTLQDIQRLLERLNDLIQNRLSSVARGPSQQAVVARYREIVLDLRSDLEKAQHSVQRAKERQELFGNNNAANNNSRSDDPAMDQLLRERNHIHNSLNAADSVIGQADSIRTDLRYQGRSLRTTDSLVNAMTTTIPGMNYLVEQIRRKRSRDDKIVASVIASCIVFTLWYVFG